MVSRVLGRRRVERVELGKSGLKSALLNYYRGECSSGMGFLICVTSFCIDLVFLNPFASPISGEALTKLLLLI